MPRLREALAPRRVVAGALVVGALLAGRRGERRRPAASGAAGWESLLGDRPVSPARRALDRRPRQAVARRRGSPPPVASRPRSRSAPGLRRRERAQRDVLARLAFQGAPIEPEHAYYGSFNGFATPLDARAPRDRRPRPRRARASSRSGRRSRPRSTSGSSTTSSALRVGGRADVGIPGFTGAGVTVALLDTGVDLVHPYIRGALAAGHRRARSRWRRERPPEPDGAGSARAPRHRDGRPRRRLGWPGRPRRASRPGRRCSRSASPAGSPTRRAASRSTAAPISCSPGIELAVDPNEDGDAHDAARIALVGCRRAVRRVHRRAAARPPRPAPSRSTRSSSRRGQRRAGRAVATAASAAPGGAPAALTAGAIDTRRRSPTAHVLLLAGLRVLVSGRPAARRRRRPGALRARRRSSRSRARRAGRRRRRRRPDPALRQRGLQPGRRRGGAAPARHVVARGRPRGRRGRCARRPRRRPAAGRLARARTARSTCRSSGSPPPMRTSCARRLLRRGVPVDARRRRRSLRRERGSRRARRRSRPKGSRSTEARSPRSAPPGSASRPPIRAATRTAPPATARSAARARRPPLTAGAAALLAQARPDLDAAGLKQALVASARRAGGGWPAGPSIRRPPPPSSSSPSRPLVGLGAALRRERDRDAATSRCGTSAVGRSRSRSSRAPPTPPTSSSTSTPSVGAAEAGRVPAGHGRRPRCRSSREPPAALGGALRVKVRGGATLRVPWTIVVPLDRPAT